MEDEKYALIKRKNFSIFLFDVHPQAFGPRRDLKKILQQKQKIFFFFPKN